MAQQKSAQPAVLSGVQGYAGAQLGLLSAIKGSPSKKFNAG